MFKIHAQLIFENACKTNVIHRNYVAYSINHNGCFRMSTDHLKIYVTILLHFLVDKSLQN